MAKTDADDAEAPSSVPTTPVCPVCGGTIRASRPDKGLQGGHSAVYYIADRLWMIWKRATTIYRKTTEDAVQDICGLRKKRS
jgi:hypothetical protein